MKSYSFRQIQTLRAFSITPIHIDTLGKFNQVTICSLFYQKLIEQRGKWIGPTELGFELIDNFRRHKIIERKLKGPIAKTMKRYVKSNLVRMKVA